MHSTGLPSGRLTQVNIRLTSVRQHCRIGRIKLNSRKAINNFTDDRG